MWHVVALATSDYDRRTHNVPAVPRHTGEETPMKHTFRLGSLIHRIRGPLGRDTSVKLHTAVCGKSLPPNDFCVLDVMRQDVPTTCLWCAVERAQ